MKTKLNNVLDTNITFMKSQSDATQEQIDDILENNTTLIGFFKVAKLCGYNVCMEAPHKKPVWLFADDFIESEE
ncbi:MAG: hypothetical protein J6U54_12690 [Clostridiales bacterium]|nr:hypothetical protein [Clostridiales bacterium]